MGLGCLFSVGWPNWVGPSGRTPRGAGREREREIENAEGGRKRTDADGDQWSSVTWKTLSFLQEKGWRDPGHPS